MSGRMPPRAWVLGLLTCGMAVSCEGCPASPADPIPRELGTLNPLFDRAGFVDFPGAVIDPSRRARHGFAQR